MASASNARLHGLQLACRVVRTYAGGSDSIEDSGLDMLGCMHAEILSPRQVRAFAHPSAWVEFTRRLVIPVQIGLRSRIAGTAALSGSIPLLRMPSEAYLRQAVPARYGSTTHS